MQRKPTQPAAILPQRDQPATRTQPQPLDPNMLRFVAGGSPYGKWAASPSSTLSPYGQW
jgi:hypothetical protein